LASSALEPLQAIAKAKKGGEKHMAVLYLAALILLGLGLLVLLKHYSPAKSGFTCRVCGKTMLQTRISWAYPLPFEIWAVVARYQLETAILSRYVCPDKHTQTWYIPGFGDRRCEVVVTKTLYSSN
jgi:hypothetical protein